MLGIGKLSASRNTYVPMHMVGVHGMYSYIAIMMYKCTMLQYINYYHICTQVHLRGAVRMWTINQTRSQVIKSPKESIIWT